MSKRKGYSDLAQGNYSKRNFKSINVIRNRNERCTSVNIVVGIMVDVGIVIVLQL